MPNEQRGAGQRHVPAQPPPRPWRARGTRWRWGCGNRLSLLKEGLQTYLLRRLHGAEGVPLTAAHLLYLATTAGAQALGLRDQVGDLSVGRRFDAIWIRPGNRTPVALTELAEINRLRLGKLLRSEG
ncbi:amidohydrolase family protein [Micromonospora sp. KLBMP9576]|uniref:amidohydrolase family protein n=1 Tax=Micromonospora sp. KLBMP9576 TaxID=3424769 RepID=UPI003D8D25BB